MRYISTRGGSQASSFADVLVGALAPDGGLYMPESWPVDAFAPASSQAYATAALNVVRQFTGDCISLEELADEIRAAYATFDDPEIAPLNEIEPDLYLLELFHGPTLAFKDIAISCWRG